MPEPITLATVAALFKASTGAAEGTAALSGASVVKEIAGGFAAGSELASACGVGKATMAFVEALKMEAPSVAEKMLGRAQASGTEFASAMGKRTTTEVGRTTLPRRTEKASRGTRAFDPVRWLDWKPKSGDVIGPQTIAERFRPLRVVDNLVPYVKNLGQRDEGFRQDFERRMLQWREAKTSADRDAALQQLRKTTAGKLGESITNDGFKPFFEKLEVQRKVETPDGNSFVDGRLTGAKNPVILGRGHGVSEGGNLSLEVKTGQPVYLKSEMRHITERQVPGHLTLGDRSLVVVSRDVYAMGGERAARDTVSAAGSHVMALLPEKSVMDEALMRVIRERMERA